MADDVEEIEEVFIPVKRASSKPKSRDPFLMKAEEARGLNGIEKNAKRRMKREIEKAFSGRIDAGSKAKEHVDISAYNLFGCVLPPYDLENLCQLYDRNPIHRAAVNAKAANIVGLGYEFVESESTKIALSRAKTKKEKDDIAEAIEDERVALNRFVDSSNSEDEFSEVLRKVWIDYESTGNGYLEIGRMRGTGQIGYIGHVPARTMRVRTFRDGFVQVLAHHVVFFRNFGDTETPNPFGDDPYPNEIIHFKKYSPMHTYYGVPDIIAAMSNVAGHEFADRFNLDYFENKAIPRHLITIKNARLSNDAMNTLVEFFEGMKGENHRTVVIPLPSDTSERKVELNVDAIETGVQDASFKNYHKINQDMTLMAHRVPITKVGLADGVSLAVARDADKNFKENVSRPEQKIIDKKLFKVFNERTRYLTFKLKELTLTDEDTQSKIDERDVKNHIRLPNEVRKSRGLPPVEGGDKMFEPTARQAADQRANNAQNRERDAQRSAGATDSAGEARNPQGEGRSAE